MHRTTLALTLLLLLSGCSGAGPKGTEDPGEPDSGELPSIPYAAFGGAMAESELATAVQLLQAALAPFIVDPELDPAKLAARVVDAVRQVPGVRAASVAADSSVTVQLRDGTPVLVVTARTRARDPIAASSRPQASAPVVKTERGGSVALSSAQTAMPLGDAAFLVSVQQLGDGAQPNIDRSLRKKGYSPASSTGTLADMRARVRDLDLLWISTHGVQSSVSLTTAEDGPKMYFYAIATGETVAEPCESSPDCAANRLDFQQMRLVRSIDLNDGRQFWSMTRAFARKYWSFKKRSLVYLDACSSMDDDPHVNALRAELRSLGVGTLLGWRSLVSKGGSNETASRFFDRVTGANEFQPPAPKQRPFPVPDVYAYLQGANLIQDRHGTATLQLMTFDADALILVPSIRTMEMVEKDRKLLVDGNFGAETGEVTVGGTPVAASWTPTRLELSIPDNGPGSAGDVVVAVRRHESNAVPLTEWKGTMAQKIVHNGLFGTPGPVFETRCSKLHFRGDVHGYRDAPGGAVKHGHDGTVQFLDATQDSACSWTASGSGTRDRTETTFLAASGTFPWFANESTPAFPQPYFFFSGDLQVEPRQLTFMLNYFTVHQVRSVILDTGMILEGPFFPLFNAVVPTLKLPQELGSDFSLPRRTGIAVPDLTGIGDTRTMDYDIPATSVPTEDTES